jgi:stress response protein YsnF
VARAKSRIVIPRVEEQITTRIEETDLELVRVRKTVESRDVELEGQAVKEHVEVERVPVNRYVHAVPPPRTEGDVTIIPVVEEIVVVEKRLLLKEEVHVKKRRHVVKRKLRVPVRRERIAVERLKPEQEREKRRRT